MVFMLILFFARFQVNVLMRLTNIEQKMEEQISMMRSVFSSLSLNIEEEEDVFPEPLDSEEELMEFEQRLSNKPYKKKMVNICLISYKLYHRKNCL